jgi:AraC-like DNA-binding protein
MIRPMLSARRIAADNDVSVRTVTCRHALGTFGESTVTDRAGVVLVRRGCFIRESEGTEQVLDSSMAYLNYPCREERFAHPHDGGDECLVIDLDLALFSELFPRAERTTRREIAVTTEIGVQHRLLEASAPDGRVEAALGLAAEVARLVAETPSAPRVSAGARRIVRDAREALAEDPTLTLAGLASALCVSSHHLSRAFSAVTGRSVSRHRIELRIGAALDRLAAGEEDLSRLAADLGFADHAHLTRTLRHHAGRTPSQMRALLAGFERC